MIFHDTLMKNKDGGTATNDEVLKLDGYGAI